MGLGSYTCPVCFCQPERAVMTLCGHILCARCLLDSLLAALKRNPNPYPGQPPSNRGRGTRGRGSRGGGRGGRGGYSNSGTHSHFSSTAGESKLGGPTEWTTETLETAWSKNLEIQYLIINGALPEIARGYTDDDRKAIVPDPGYFHVIEVLKGLWKIEPGGYIVEGECPVCRKPLPGGFAPPDTGFGGVIPLQLRLGGIDNT
ncbi:hypothetical protein BCR39DRAFT_274869 [Naematelia encephala]|uniref:RING-type domain-containing protein n=1 Tax=Naematelia encephala TaxID=71784 RepID=A0A1Y2AUX3_9TREE|nr:hypothetical protein BCR39DRAFT_274869 [Naematelia encephala]